MTAATRIEWTDRTWCAAKTAAKRLRLPMEEYVARIDSGLKYCWRCRAWKPTNRFGVDRSRTDGRAAVCIACRRPRPKQLPLLRETASEYKRRRYATDAAYRFRRQQRTSRRRRGVDAVPLEGREQLTERFSGLCAYCPSVAATWDHIVPVSHGGKTLPGNIVPACRSCNSRKGDRHVYDFIDIAGVVASNELLEALAMAAMWGELE